MNKKLQVFVSSTFTDLIEERQAAVQAILDAGHIPAGMELFKAGNESQLKTIYQWIDASDVYMLILGGRYGSIEPDSGKSYTQLEYEYAASKDIPVFAVVLSHSFLTNKINALGLDKVMEQINPANYQSFKSLVMSKIVREVDDCKDIKISLHTTLNDFMHEYHLTGWVRSTSENDTSQLPEENTFLKKENALLKEENTFLKKENRLLKEENALLKEENALLKEENALLKKENGFFKEENALLKKGNSSLIKEMQTSAQNQLGNYSFDELITIFKNKIFTMDVNLSKVKKGDKINALNFFILYYNFFATGVSGNNWLSNEHFFIYNCYAPYYESFQLLEKKVHGRHKIFIITPLGSAFYTMLESKGISDI